jgi:hypothetical protein
MMEKKAAKSRFLERRIVGKVERRKLIEKRAVKNRVFKRNTTMRKARRSEGRLSTRRNVKRKV